MSDTMLKARNPHDRKIVERPVDALKPYARNARTHSKKQIKQIALSIERFGFVNPVLIGDDYSIIAGHGRVEAAKLLGHKTVPTLEITHLSDTERRAYILADNKLALDTADDKVPSVAGPAVTCTGDLWVLGRHKLLCGDARDELSFQRLVGNELVDLLFTDPPYNVKIDGNVCGLGTVKHREFAFASGEMSEDQFTAFLKTTLGNASCIMRNGAIAYVCMDWRHMGEMLAAGKSAFTELKNLVVWNKTNGGMGTFYRSKHELIFVFKNGTAPHINSFGLGETGEAATPPSSGTKAAAQPTNAG